MSTLNFPSTFHWGVATSSYQIEGAAHEGGRGPSIWDTFSHTPGKVLNGDTGDVACDHYHRLEEDLDLIQSLGVDSYRFSIAWPRVQPLGYGAWNPEGLAFYDRLVDGLLARGIAPHITLYHWDLPQGLQDRGGWESRETALHFAEYARVMAERLGDRAASICTHNEPWCTAVLGNELGRFAPGIQDQKVMLRVAHHLLLSHGLALQAMRAAGVKTPLGIVLNQSPATPATNSPADVALAAKEYAMFVRWYMDPLFKKAYPEGADLPVCDVVQAGDMDTIAQPMDFLGINYYTRIWSSAATPPVPAPNANGVSDMGWENYAQGLTDLLVGIHSNYTLPPIFITENGFASPDAVVDGKVVDPRRIDYMRTHLQALLAAMAAGVNVQGFFYWSLMDNFEWDSGYDKRFGLFHVDYATQVRTAKDSAHWYRALIAQHRAT
ncbi:MAG: beta-glucosidase [Curvibacter sp. RIFCSPHIGHO2_12_FULL_63_18]|uniref:GH1 family beta-glucosidase n=1 Tax=Rhodoferax sp. TaxID=50421 RepID=UPI0008C18AF5|nr:GH1 family beta-glucosidase [Rhodoferax sp.]OGO99753.1 MAG: beta-glucosidase [Curvibacter sp. RIFCSPHIGHO2_12_FULL_63_18]OGP00418.1 MAG: beta-glucosidase [Curvibacter sp. GWA2_63_95]HCX82020.1 beta-glucosidase [Rhodoferax sp.]